jgi:RNA polymerase-binding transcription factor DksA
LELEGQNAELRGAVSEMTNRMEKYRKSYKDLASEHAAQKNEVSVKEEELSKYRRHVEKIESTLRNVS